MQKLPLRANPNFFKESRLVRTRAFSVYIRPNSVEKFRYAVVVPKKIVPLATRRNALKRQISSLMYLLNFDNSVQDIVFRVGNNQLLDERSKIMYELKNIIDKAHLGL